MVKLLRYYVSEDAVYLHLEHVKGEVLTCALTVDGMMLHKKRSVCLHCTINNNETQYSFFM